MAIHAVDAIGPVMPSGPATLGRLQAIGSAAPGRGGDELRARINELVGMTFFGTLLKQMQTSELRGEYGHGGRGEEIFQSQLHAELAQRAGAATQFDIGEAMYRRLAGKGAAERGGRTAGPERSNAQEGSNRG